MNAQRRRAAGFTLLPVILVMTLIASVAYLLNRDNGINAAMVASQGDQDRARYAAEAGLQAVNADIQTRNCSGFYPAILSKKTNSNFGGASYAAYAIIPWGNVTSLSSTGTYNGTSVTLTRSNVIAYQAAPQTYTLQPNAAAGKDTYISSFQKTRNSGIDPYLYLGGAYESLLQFDLSIFPAGSRVFRYFASGALQPGALMSLYQMNTPGGSGAMSANLITRSWIEGTGWWSFSDDGATWNTYDGVNNWPAPGMGYDTRAISSTPYAPAIGWKSWDVTDAVQAWMGGVYPNYGVWLRSPSSPSFWSSDHATAANRPKVNFTYLLPCGTTAPVTGPPEPITVTLNAVADSYVEGNPARYTINFGASPTLLSYPANNADLRILFRFDTSAIPSGSIIKSAKLRSYVSGVGGAKATRDISAYTLTESWLEGTGDGAAVPGGVTWSTRDGSTAWTTAGGSYRPTAVALATDESNGNSPPARQFSSGWLTWTLTPLVQEWVDGMTPNNGVILINSSSKSEFITFESKESATGNTPQLVITY